MYRILGVRFVYMACFRIYFNFETKQCGAFWFEIVHPVLYRLLQRSDSNVKSENVKSLQRFRQIYSKWYNCFY